MHKEFLIPSLGRCDVDSPLNIPFFVDDSSAILLDATLEGCRDCQGTPPAMEQAGPRKKIFFNPAETRAAIVTCGGLCPGLNDVIRAITMVLWHRYGVRNILGLRYGYEGLVPGLALDPLVLTPDRVEDIHQDGGTVLGSSRGPQDVGVMLDFLETRKINMLFTVGGDGTQRGALEMVEEIQRRKTKMVIVGIPKTIDNDISYTEKTFGFETAVAMCQGPITSAHMEAKGVRNGVGLVKLMGRESGFVAAYAALASSDVNLVLVPEVPFSLKMLLHFLEQRLEEKAHAVIVAAEGAGQDLVPWSGVNKSGNKNLGDIGVFLKETITQHFQEKDIPIAVKYLDPSYSIRSAPATADDSVFCFQLAGYAVHAAMAGRTGLLVGLWNGHYVHVPMAKAVGSRKIIDVNGSFWASVMDNTGQPANLV